MEMQLAKKYQETLIKVLNKALEEESKIPYSKKKGEILDILRLSQALQIRFRGSYKTNQKII
jgi:hydrogenase maturation factor HypF (carbamoyltransferase family)